MNTIKPPMTLDDIKTLRDDAVVAINEMERDFPSLNDGSEFNARTFQRCFQQTRTLLLYLRRIGELPLLSDREIDMRARRW